MLNSTPGTTFFTVRLFSSPTADDPSGFGEGRRLVGSRSVTTDGEGNASFGIRVDRRKAPVGSSITATATDPTGNTSELSAAKTVGQ